MEQVKFKDEPLTEEMLVYLLQHPVFVPVNQLEIDGQVENVWFCGRVAGYEKAVLAYSYENHTFSTPAQTYYSLLLTDGLGHTLSNDKLVILRLTEEEYQEIITEEMVKTVEELLQKGDTDEV